MPSCRGRCAGSTSRRRATLLADAASALSAVTRERDDLRKQVEELSEQACPEPDRCRTARGRAAHGEAGGRRADRQGRPGRDGDPRRGRAGPRSTAERQRTSLLVQAQAQADDLVREGAATAQSLAPRGRGAAAVDHGAPRRSSSRSCGTALDQLDGVESVRPAVAETTDLDGDLLAQLPSEQ